MKKVWEKPKLVVLVRSKPEEAILVSCKLASGAPSNSGAEHLSCKGTEVCDALCSVTVAT